MFRIGKTLVSEEIIENNFHCNISKCKGACCIEGSAGAPLQQNEAELLAKDFDKISKILKDFSKDLFIYFRLSVKTPPAQNVSLYETVKLSNNLEFYNKDI